MKAQRRWALLVYMAADNNLHAAAALSLKRMLSAGSTSRVALIAEINTWRQLPMRRYFFAQGAKSLEECLVSQHPNIDSGYASEIERFVVWAIRKYPAESTALILWGHGTGLDGSLFWDFPYNATRRRQAKLMNDYHTGHYVSDEELKKALLAIEKATHRKIAILGMDACVMSMIEVCYQLIGTAQISVGSETIIPVSSWPYQDLVQKLDFRPRMSPIQLSRLMVNSYVGYYRNGRHKHAVTLSATDLSKVLALAEAVKVLVKAIQSNFTPEVVSMLFCARAKVQEFFVRDYVDLIDLCRQIAGMARQIDRHIQQAAENVVTESHFGKPVVASGRDGKSLSRSTGLSIYFPRWLLLAGAGIASFPASFRPTRDELLSESQIPRLRRKIERAIPIIRESYARLPFSRFTGWSNFLLDIWSYVDQGLKAQSNSEIGGRMVSPKSGKLPTSGKLPKKRKKTTKKVTVRKANGKS